MPISRFLAAAGLTAGLLAGCGILGGGGASYSDGPRPRTFAGQAAAGQGVYATHCFRCHDVPDPKGPKLTVPLLAARENAQSLFEAIRNTMPQDAPGSLSEGDYWYATAYLISRTGLASPEEPLLPETAEKVEFPEIEE